MSEISKDVKSLAVDAVETLDSNAEAIYTEVRKGVAQALEQGKQMFGSAYNRALQDGKYADRMMQNHLYQTICFGIGAGILVGYLCARRSNCKRD